MLTDGLPGTEKSAEAHLAEAFCGNREAVEALAGMVVSGRMPHAFIVEGADGLGKSTFAGLIARCAMCTCAVPLAGTCSHCRKLREHIHPDLTVITGSGKTNAIAIDAVRAMRTDCRIAPNEAEKRVFVLEDCDNMQPAAQNAFLKIFEEAPPHVVFVMTCRSAMHLLETIRSRGRIITLYPVDPAEGADFLCRQYPTTDKAAAAAACEQCGGNLGEALRQLRPDDGGKQAALEEQAAGIVRGILSAMCGSSELTLAAACHAIGKDRALAGAICIRLSEALCCAMMVSVGAGETLEHPSQEVLRLGTLVSASALMRHIQEINMLSDWLRINISMPLFNTRLAIVLQRR